ncbi:hypothetical protein DKX15_18855, partial [Enterococcus faecium]
ALANGLLKNAYGGPGESWAQDGALPGQDQGLAASRSPKPLTASAAIPASVKRECSAQRIRV